MNNNNIEALAARLEAMGTEDFDAMVTRIATAPADCLPQLEASTKVMAGVLAKGEPMPTGAEVFDIIAATSSGAPEFFAGDAARTAAEAIATALMSSEFIKEAIGYLICTLAH